MQNTNTTTTKITKGSTVKWRSQSQGVHKAKKGTVAAIVKAGQKPPASFAKNFSRGITTRNHVSYIVSAVGGKIYWPRTSALKVG